MDITMQLNILHLLCLDLILALPRSFRILTRAPKQTSSRFEAIDVLSV
jgi:hypothetical protein